MAPKASEMVISYRGFRGLVEGGLEAVANNPPDPGAAPSDPVEDAAMVAGLEDALILLKNAENDPRAQNAPEVFRAFDHRPASLLQSILAQQAAEGTTKANQIPLANGGYEAQFDEKDALGWAASLRSWWRRYLDRHPFQPPPAQPDKIENSVRLAMLGDWGTGLYGAPTCARSIAGAKPAYDILLHLGNVYYAGTEPEVEGRFLNLWPDIPNVISRAINSNHEMYSGGNAYFRQTLAVFHQSSSLFALRNDHWILLGLDSAYEGNDRVGGNLSDLQAGWVAAQVNEAVKNGQRVILLSHHQPFSLFETQGAILAECLKEALAAHKIFAWYWGHEHRCVIYERHPDWNLYGRCIGHSGYPYFRDIFPGAVHPQINSDGSRWIRLIARKTAPTGTVLDGPNPYIKGHENQYGPNGYLTLEFSDSHLNEIVRASDGTILFENQLS